jgi:uncharacterized membrane protein (DUF2068 family)
MDRAVGGQAPLGERLIVAYKFGKAALELAAAAAVPIVAARGLPHDVLQLSLALHEHLSARWSHLYDALLSAGRSPHLRVVAAALALDGVVSLIEGWGVWRRRPWGPWVIVVATGGLIPLELVALLERPTAIKAAILALNVATVAYMVHRRMQARSPGAAAGAVTTAAAAAQARRRRPGLRAALALAAAALGGYVGLAYVALPWLVQHRQAARAVTVAPDRAVDGAGRPSDPLNVGLVGTREDVVASMDRAGWVAAQGLSRRSGADIAADVLLHRSDPNAPVSSLFFDGRRQDLAFEQQVGGSPRRRHHVRLWLHQQGSVDGRPLWLGATSYDRGVGLARGTGEITHVIDPDIDAERDKLMQDLVRCRCARSVHRVPGVGPIPQRHRARIHTDGMAAVAVLAQFSL